MDSNLYDPTAGLSSETTQLEARIDAAAVAASSTHRDWESRCRAVLAALGLDYGEPDTSWGGQLISAVAHLQAAASAYRKYGSRHKDLKPQAKDDPMFLTRAADFEKAAAQARALLKGSGTPSVKTMRLPWLGSAQIAEADTPIGVMLIERDLWGDSNSRRLYLNDKFLSAHDTMDGAKAAASAHLRKVLVELQSLYVSEGDDNGS